MFPPEIKAAHQRPKTCQTKQARIISSSVNSVSTPAHPSVQRDARIIKSLALGVERFFSGGSGSSAGFGFSGSGCGFLALAPRRPVGLAGSQGFTNNEPLARG